MYTILGRKGPDKISNFSESMRETLQVLTNAKKDVIFVMDIPMLGFRPISCIDRPWRITGELVKNPCAIPRVKVDAEIKQYTEIVTKVLREFPKVKIWNPMNVMCDDAFCWAVKDGVMLYRDGDHLNESGSLYIGKRLELQ